MQSYVKMTIFMLNIDIYGILKKEFIVNYCVRSKCSSLLTSPAYKKIDCLFKLTSSLMISVASWLDLLTFLTNFVQLCRQISVKTVNVKKSSKKFFLINGLTLSFTLSVIKTILDHGAMK